MRLLFQQEVEVVGQGVLLGVFHPGFEYLHLVGFANQREVSVLQEECGGFADGGDGGAWVDHDILLQAVVAGLAAMLGVEEVGVVRVDLERHKPHTVERDGHDDRHVVGGAQSGAGHVASGAPTHIGHPVEGALADGLEEAGALQLAHEVEGVAAAHGHAVGLVDGIDGQGLVVDGGEAHAELLEYRCHLALVGVVALGEAALGKRDTRVGHEKHVFDVVATAEVGDNVLAPAEVGLAAHGAVADEKKVAFVHDDVF